MNDACSTKVQRNYKDGMFRSIFNSKEKIIGLFNAVEGTNYDLNSKFELKTLEDAIYIKNKNDLAFLLEDRFVVLIEHQSTLNPNMPLRMLSYISRVYEKMYKDKAIYSTAKMSIAIPEFIVLYNGDKETQECEELKLSSLYMGQAPANSIELVVRFINICYNESKEILKRSHELMGYSIFNHYVKERLKSGETKEEAIKYAIEKCLEENILEDFLKEHSSEVINMLFEEITLEEYGDIREADGIKQGRAEGKAEGKVEAIINLMKNQNWSVEQAMDAIGAPPSDRAEMEKIINKIISDRS